MKAETSMERAAVDTIRTLSMDAVQAANSGHPGTPMALAPVVYALWQHALRTDPADPGWPNRDRFILSAGHASMLLYSILHLAGVRALGEDGKPLDRLSITLDDIRNFRQLGSPCAGHPERHLAAGVEVTTGPLGQGLSNSVGVALAARWMAARYNRPGFDVIDYSVYALGSDGCIMEGVSSEAASLAGHLRLGNLCWLYDNNRITIEGGTHLALSEDVATRFRGYGWRVERVEDANDVESVKRALDAFRTANDRPTLIIVDSHIGWGAPHKQDTASAHGEPLGEEEVRLAKRAYGWPEEEKFLVPEGVREHFAAGVGKRGAERRGAWVHMFEEYRKAHPEPAREFETLQRRELPAGWDADIPAFPADAKGAATRATSGKVLNAIARRVPWLLGGSADLGPSTKTLLDGEEDQSPATPGGRNLHFGVREHAMGAVINGLSTTGVRPYGATFFVFTDYMRPAMRLSSIMELPVIYVLTHDSIGLGEDGPTHQPVEHLASLRAMPGMITLRPADANEVAEAWRVIMPLRDRPVALVLSRQSLPTLDRAAYAPANGVARGAYVLTRDEGTPQVILLATGSEVALCVEAYQRLKAEGVRARVVSVPSFELFDEQDAAYRESVLPGEVTARVAVEQGATFGWERYVGTSGRVLGMTTFGASAPDKVLREHFGFTVENVVAAAREQMHGAGGGGGR